MKLNPGLPWQKKIQQEDFHASTLDLNLKKKFYT
jgi:hypothetical protein